MQTEQIKLKRDGSQVRNNKLLIKLSPSEKKVIAQKAIESNMSMSSYIRNVSMGYHIQSKADRQGIADLLKFGASQGRLGGLLKKLITQIDLLKSHVTVKEVRDILHKIEYAQEDILSIIDELKKF